jgi:hypothetical protein
VSVDFVVIPSKINIKQRNEKMNVGIIILFLVHSHLQLQSQLQSQQHDGQHGQ